MYRYLIVAALLSGVAAAGWLSLGTGDRPDPPRTAGLQAGKSLYRDYCAACHGADLQGQPDWQSPGPDGVLPAPPHDRTGHTWHHSDDLLFDYTSLGGRAALARRGIDFNSGMPGFGDRLTDAEIRDILAYIKSTWPERERAVQAERTRRARDPNAE